MSSSNWWANKLGPGMPPVPQRQEMPMPPSQRPMTPFVQPAPQQQQYKPPAEFCPNCHSENYIGPQGSQKRCYDCGYPIEQSGSKYGSLTGAKVEGPTKGSLGNNAQSNWNPQGIIGRIQ